MKKTFFFGGSFDPPHSGHLGAANGALKTGRAEHILWAPAFAPPHKTGWERAPFADRLAMVRMLTAGDARHEPCDFEWRLRRTPSYTLDVLRLLRRERPELTGLLIGADSLLELHTWHKPEALIAEFEILTYPRNGYSTTTEALARHWPPETVKKLLAGLLPGNFFDVSSTRLRRDGETPDAPAVREYCRRHALYGVR